MSKVYSVYYCDGHYDHHLFVPANSEDEAMQILKDKYIPTLEIDASAETASDEDLDDFNDLTKKQVAEMKSKGYHIFDVGS